jgi:hypothetical protein
VGDILGIGGLAQTLIDAAMRAWRSWGLGRFSQFFDLHIRVPALEYR